ncbi:AAA family ATPase [Patescibacteria group bacterium]
MWFFGESGWLSLILIWLIDSYLAFKKPLAITKEVEIDKANSYMTKELKKIVKASKHEANQLKQRLFDDKEIQEMLTRVELTAESFKNSPSFLIYKEWVGLAIKQALELEDQYIKPAHFLLSLLKVEDFRYQETKQAIQLTKKQKKWAKTPFVWEKDYENKPIGGVDRAWTGIPTPTLDKYSTDLTKKAQKAQLPEIFGKKEVTGDLVKILSRKKQNNALVIGDPGSGKTTLVKGIAQEIVRGVKESSLSFKRLVSLDSSKLAAGANSAELNTRIIKIIEEIVAAENIILFVDEVHNLASINQDLPETSDLFIALEPPLSDGQFQFIGATTTENFKKYIEPNEAFARLFEVVELKEASKEKALEVIEYMAWKLERSEKVIISSIALQTIVNLASQYVRDRVLPDSAVNLLDEVVTIIKEKDGQVATSLEVEKLVTKKTKVPVERLTKKTAEKLLKIEDQLHKRVIGQDKAIKALGDAIRRARTKLKDPNKPIAAFLFAGPTGVGKTETAKTLAAEFFGSERQMIRLDMSEYQNLDSLNRLIGAPPGRSTIDEGGQLTEAVKHQPYTLVLLDEIEKAHAKILNVFLQVLDDARLTDSRGKLVDFSNTIIIATTNVGTRELIAGSTEKAREKLENHYPPEFLNRFTGLIVFESLTEKEIKEIVKLKLENLRKELEKQEIIN